MNQGSGVRSPLAGMDRRALEALTGDPRQVASVRGIVLDDGSERGTRALVFSTGGGLDFWVLTDRSMDIGPLWIRGTPLAWSHPSGFVAPSLHDPEAAGGTGIERVLSGFLVTCGLENVRQPRDGHPLHGTLPLTPARLLAAGEEWDASPPILFAEGSVTRAGLGGTSLRLTRRIEAPIGGRSIVLRDRVENIGLKAAEIHLLYHLNFGFPAIVAGTEVVLDDEPEPLLVQDTDGKPFISCRRSGQSHRFEVRLHTPAGNGHAGISAVISGPTAALPFVQVWSDPRPRRNVIAIEPTTSDRRADGTSDTGRALAPGETWSADLMLEFAEAAA